MRLLLKHNYLHKYIMNICNNKYLLLFGSLIIALGGCKHSPSANKVDEEEPKLITWTGRDSATYSMMRSEGNIMLVYRSMGKEITISTNALGETSVMYELKNSRYRFILDRNADGEPDIAIPTGSSDRQEVNLVKKTSS